MPPLLERPGVKRQVEEVKEDPGSQFHVRVRLGCGHSLVQPRRVWKRRRVTTWAYCKECRV